MEEEKKLTLLGSYAFAGTVLSGFLSAHLMYSILPEDLGVTRWILGALVAILLDVGLWAWHKQIHRAKTEGQRNLYIIMVVFFWILMLTTSIADGFLSAYKTAVYSADFWQGVSIIIVSGVGNLVVGAYLLNNILDPDYQQKIAEVSALIERQKTKESARSAFEEENGYILAGIELIEEQKKAYNKQHNRPMPAYLLSALISKTGIPPEILEQHGIISPK